MTTTIDHKLQTFLSGGVSIPHTFSMGLSRIFTPALVRDVIMQVGHSITSPIIVEAVGVIPCLLRSSREVDCVTYECELCCRHS